MQRLLIDAPAAGAVNMARDQAILEQVDHGGEATLRFYRWAEPTLSLGYFQRVADRQLHPASQSLTLIRRSTGGGAIVHDRELTYSLAVPLRDRTSDRATMLYRQVHQAVIAALAQWQIPIARFADTPVARTKHAWPETFLCFQRRTDDDLILAGYKIVGSAQRRTARAVLQHGSILLEASRHAPELPGIGNLITAQIELTPLIEAITAQIEQQLNMRFTAGVTPQSVIARTEEIVEARFGNSNWTARRP